jgi:hypothetical protein
MNGRMTVHGERRRTWKEAVVVFPVLYTNVPGLKIIYLINTFRMNALKTQLNINIISIIHITNINLLF